MSEPEMHALNDPYRSAGRAPSLSPLAPEEEMQLTLLVAGLRPTPFEKFLIPVLAIGAALSLALSLALSGHVGFLFGAVYLGYAPLAFAIKSWKLHRRIDALRARGFSVSDVLVAGATVNSETEERHVRVAIDDETTPPSESSASDEAVASLGGWGADEPSESAQDSRPLRGGARR